MTKPAISTLYKPDSPLPLVFDSPHSGRDYPADFRFSCPFPMLEKAEDNTGDNTVEWPLTRA